MKVKLLFDDIDSDKEEFLADLLFEIVDVVMNVFKEDKKEVK